MAITSRWFSRSDWSARSSSSLSGFQNVVAIDGAQFGAAHAKLAHGGRGDGDIRRKHVGNGSDVESLHYSFIRSSLRYSVFRSMPSMAAARLLLPPVAASTRRI